MSKEIIAYNEIDFEENPVDFFKGLKYKGEAFTGILKEENTTTEFKNGNAHGFEITRFSNGQLCSENYYEEGEFLRGKCWYENGNLKQLSNSGIRYMNAMDGKLAYESKEGVNTWYYRNGKRKQEEISKLNQKKCFAPNGQLAISIERKEHIAYAEFFDEVLIEHYQEIISNPYPELDDLSSNSEGQDHFPKHGFQLWVLKLREEQSALGKKVMRKLNRSKNDKIKYMAGIIKMHWKNFSLEKIQQGSYGYCGHKVNKS